MIGESSGNCMAALYSSGKEYFLEFCHLLSYFVTPINYGRTQKGERK